jgi:hypothetical protein
MDATKKIFSRDPEVMGGQLVFAGTRVEVKTLVVSRGDASPLLGVALVESGDLRVVGVEDDVPSARRVETVAGFGIPSGGEPFAFLDAIDGSVHPRNSTSGSTSPGPGGRRSGSGASHAGGHGG